MTEELPARLEAARDKANERDDAADSAIESDDQEPGSKLTRLMKMVAQLAVVDVLNDLLANP